MCTTLSTVSDGDSDWPYKSSNRSCQVSMSSLSALSQQAHHSTNIYIQWDCHIQLLNIAHKFYQAKDLLKCAILVSKKQDGKTLTLTCVGVWTVFSPICTIVKGHLWSMVLSSSPHFSLKQLFVQNSFSNSLSKQYDGFKVELSHLALKMIQQSLSFSFAIGLDSIPKEAANKQYKK